MVLLSFVVGYYSTHAQISNYLKKDTFNWYLWDKVRNKYDKYILVDSLNKQFNLGLIDCNEDNFEQFKFIDFNSDGRNDLIFIGPSGNNNNSKTIFFLNKGNAFKKLFHLDGELIYVERSKPWSPISFELIRNTGNENLEIETYVHAFIDGKLEYRTTGTYIIKENMKLIGENVPPRPFQMPKAGLTILTHPDPYHGKPIKKYYKGHIGFVIASNLNRSGNIWWLVMLQEENNKYRIGWVNSAEIKGI